MFQGNVTTVSSPSCTKADIDFFKLTKLAATCKTLAVYKTAVTLVNLCCNKCDYAELLLITSNCIGTGVHLVYNVLLLRSSGVQRNG